MFDSFITFGKPIVAAVNGPAFGGGVTQATLCDSVVSSRHATYSLPFSQWRVSPEGCSSVHVARVVGIVEARRMLAGGWIPDADEAKLIGLVAEVSHASITPNHVICGVFLHLTLPATTRLNDKVS